MLVDFCQVQDPLAPVSGLPPISLVIPCHDKDFSTLAYVIESARAASHNPIDEIVLITPTSTQSILQQRFPQATVRSDDEILGKALIDFIRETVPAPRFGWALQQVVKFLAVARSPHDASLILDADTMLLSPTTFLDSDGRQALSYSHEFHRPYAEHTSRFWLERGASLGMSFVTHSQLMQRDIVNEMFPDLENDLKHWLGVASWASPSAVSEYHSYGTWLVNTYPHRAAFAVWGNTTGDWSVLASTSGDSAEKVHALAATYPGARSVSFHSYLR
jgi:hypothetical protein